MLGLFRRAKPREQSFYFVVADGMGVVERHECQSHVQAFHAFEGIAKRRPGARIRVLHVVAEDNTEAVRRIDEGIYEELDVWEKTQASRAAAE